jgi:hypothetical protein
MTAPNGTVNFKMNHVFYRFMKIKSRWEQADKLFVCLKYHLSPVTPSTMCKPGWPRYSPPTKTAMFRESSHPFRLYFPESEAVNLIPEIDLISLLRKVRHTRVAGI